jgi:hypothetical protein
MNPFINDKKRLLSLLTGYVVVCFGVLPKAQAVVPAPDGCYPNFTTAEGCNALLSLTSGAANTGVGWSSLLSVSTGSFNTGVGAGTLALNTGDSNTAVGVAALLLNIIGTNNTANGTAALVNNSSGNSNSAFGAFALNNNVDGAANTAVGFQTLFSNTNGVSNTATGANALFHNTGSFNTAVGDAALVFNTIGSNNTAVGSSALQNNDAGIVNTANGACALLSNTGGQGNTATGDHALFSNTTANFNTANGNSALSSNTGSGNTAVGSTALANNTTGNGNIALGNNAGANVVAASNVTCIGAVGADVDNSCYISRIHGATSSGGLAVFINADGRLGTTTSSRRFKDGIKSMERASETLFALRPVTFRYMKAIDPQSIPQFGLLAEDVEAVNPDLVVRDQEGKPYSVRYEQVNAMLLNEFLKEHKKVEEQQATIAELKSTVAQQQKGFESKLAKQEEQIEVLTAGLQKVSAQIELSKSSPQTVLNDQ